MAKITKDMIPYAYDIAKRVYEGSLGFQEGRHELSSTTSMSFGSTGDFINNFRSMLSGEKYSRTLNLYATEYFLEHIGQDYGRKQQMVAAQAVKKHVEYYKSKQGYLRSTDELADKYL